MFTKSGLRLSDKQTESAHKLTALVSEKAPILFLGVGNIFTAFLGPFAEIAASFGQYFRDPGSERKENMGSEWLARSGIVLAYFAEKSMTSTEQRLN